MIVLTNKDVQHVNSVILQMADVVVNYKTGAVLKDTMQTEIGTISDDFYDSIPDFGIDYVFDELPNNDILKHISKCRYAAFKNLLNS